MLAEAINKEELLQQQVASLEMEWEFRYRRYLAHANVPTISHEGTITSNTNEKKKEKDKEEKWYKVYHLIGDFMTHCNQIVKQIVHKHPDLQPLDPFDHRFILKLNNENIYYKDNIVIRIARIVKPASSKDPKDQVNLEAQLLYQEFIANDLMNDILISMYKTTKERDENKIKFHVPLCCLVEYMGYRAFCQADTLFHGYDTVAYGPISESEFRTNKRVQDHLFKIGKSLNFKPYKVVTSSGLKVTVPFSLKCQVHYYKSQKYQPKMKIINKQSDLYDVWQKNQKREEYYIYGLSRLWPHFVDKGLENNVGWLRPQVVRRWSKPLDSSAFLGIASQIDQQSELQLADACKTVQDELTTMFANELDKGQTRYFAKQLGQQKVSLIDSESVITAFHERGINLRFMGAVANKSQMPHIKAILKIQMVAKVLKNIFYTQCDASKHPTMKQDMVDFLNLIFHPTKESKYFFQNLVYPRVSEYFDFHINEFPLSVPGGGLLHAIMYHFGVELQIIDYAFFIPQEKQPFTNTAVIDFVASADSFHFQTSSPKQIANLYRKKGISREDTKETKSSKLIQKLKEIQILISYYKGRNNQVTAPKGPKIQAFFYSQVADIYSEIDEPGKAVEYANKAHEYANKALALIPGKHARLVNPLCVIIKYHSMNNRLVKSLEFFDRALAAIAYHLGQNHPLYINVYNTIGNQFLNHGETEKCDKILKKSLDICALTLGNLHRSRSQILVILSKLPVNHTTTVEYLTQALMILESTEATQQQIRDICKRIAEKYEAIGDNHNMLYYAKKSGDWILQIRAAERNQDSKFVIQLCQKPTIDKEKTPFLLTKETVPFLLKVCFRANLDLLNKQAVKRLKKYYVAFQDLSQKNSRQSIEAIIQDLKKYHFTIARLVDECISTLLVNYVQMVSHPLFYTQAHKVINESRDNYAKRAYRVYLSIIDLYDQKEIESLFALFI